MENLYRELVICKYDLTRIILNKKTLDKMTLNEVKAKLLLVNNLRKQLRETNDLDCSEQLTEVKEYILKIKEQKSK